MDVDGDNAIDYAEFAALFAPEASPQAQLQMINTGTSIVESIASCLSDLFLHARVNPNSIFYRIESNRTLTILQEMMVQSH